MRRLLPPRHLPALITVLGVGLAAFWTVSSAAQGQVVREVVQIDDQPKTSIVDLKYQRTSGAQALVCQTYLLIEPPDPVATVVLFVGGSGRLGLSDATVGVTSTNFLFRTRHDFAAAGPFNIALIDAPFEGLASLDGECSGNAGDLVTLRLAGTRIGDAHMEDVETVIADLRDTLGPASGPVIVAGTSRGTISAGNAAAVLQSSPPDGLVLTAPVTVDVPNRDSLNDVPLEQVSVPSLVVSHQQDGCFVTPPSDVEMLKARLKAGASSVKIRLFDGGLPALSDACASLSEHGFFGIERKVVDFIAKWIRKRVN